MNKLCEISLRTQYNDGESKTIFYPRWQSSTRVLVLDSQRVVLFGGFHVASR
jgi:hypothetical protein